MTETARLALVRIGDAPEPALEAALRTIGPLAGTIAGRDPAQLAGLAALAPTVVVLDLRDCRDDDVSPWVGATRRASPRANLVVVGRAADEAGASQAIAGGALAFLSRDLSVAALNAAIRETGAGRLHLVGTGRRAAQGLLRRASKRTKT